MIPAALALTLLTAPAPEPRDPALCLEVSNTSAFYTLTGRLTKQTFAGPPNYESVEEGDAPERVLVLNLPEAICADDGGQFIVDPEDRFTSVQVESINAEVRTALDTAGERTVTITGHLYPAHTGHHHTPVVMEASVVEPR